MKNLFRKFYYIYICNEEYKIFLFTFCIQNSDILAQLLNHLFCRCKTVYNISVTWFILDKPKKNSSSICESLLIKKNLHKDFFNGVYVLQHL